MAEPTNKIAGYQNLINNFDGDLFSNVKYFFENIESIGTLAEWKDPELIVVLKSKLRGLALQFFIDDPELNQEKEFKNIKEKFLKYFDQKTTLSQRQMLFSNCRQAPGESVRSFATKVANLTAKYFGAGNISKPDVVPIVDQTKLAKFLEGLQPSLKNLAMNRNHKTFDEAVEQAQLDEINAQFSASEVVPINNFNSTPQVNIEDKLNNIISKQTEMTERLVNSLSEQIQNLRFQHPPPLPLGILRTFPDILDHQICIVYCVDEIITNPITVIRGLEIHIYTNLGSVRRIRTQDPETTQIIRFISRGHLHRVNNSIRNILVTTL